MLFICIFAHFHFGEWGWGRGGGMGLWFPFLFDSIVMVAFTSKFASKWCIYHWISFLDWWHHHGCNLLKISFLVLFISPWDFLPWYGHGWLVGWLNGWSDAWLDAWLDAWMHGCMDIFGGRRRWSRSVWTGFDWFGCLIALLWAPDRAVWSGYPNQRSPAWLLAILELVILHSWYNCVIIVLTSAYFDF